MEGLILPRCSKDADSGRYLGLFWMLAVQRLTCLYGCVVLLFQESVRGRGCQFFFTQDDVKTLLPDVYVWLV